MRKFSRNDQVVDAAGRPTQMLQIFSEQVSRLDILSGTGSPEGVIKAQKKVLYMDESGGTGSILYIKQKSDIGGDKSLGWIPV